MCLTVGKGEMSLLRHIQVVVRNNFITYESGPGGENSREWGLNCCRFSQIGKVEREKPLLGDEMRGG